jgi:hypothetical protein
MSRADQRERARSGILHSKPARTPLSEPHSKPSLPALPFDPHELAAQHRLVMLGNRYYGDIDQLPKRRRFWVGDGVNEASEDGQPHDVRIVKTGKGPGAQYALELVR